MVVLNVPVGFFTLTVLASCQVCVVMCPLCSPLSCAQVFFTADDEYLDQLDRFAEAQGMERVSMPHTHFLQ